MSGLSPPMEEPNMAKQTTQEDWKRKTERQGEQKKPTPPPTVRAVKPAQRPAMIEDPNSAAWIETRARFFA